MPPSQAPLVKFRNSTYMGGLVAFPKETPKNVVGLVFDAAGISGPLAAKVLSKGKTTTLAASEIESIEITDTLARHFGGSILAQQTCAALTVFMKSGEEASFVFEIPGVALRGKISPWAKSHDIPWHTDQQQSVLRSSLDHGAALSVTDEIMKAAQLHKDGLLTDEEFADTKRKILSGS